MIEAYSFHAVQPGKRLLILGGVHGNEVCGPAAIRKALKAFQTGKMRLKKGSVSFLPLANPEAYRQGRRFTEHNLNRSFRRHEAPQLYEERLQNLLVPYLEDCDVLLDIHSYRAGGPAFAFRGPDRVKDAEEALAAALGIHHVIYGWNEAYQACGMAIDPELSTGTTEYARRKGALALTLECGQHKDPKAVGVALKAIQGALEHCGLIEGKNVAANRDLKRTRLKKMFYKEREGKFLKPWKHLQDVKEGEGLARMENGDLVTAPFTGRIVLPHEAAPVGQEWLYMGVDETWGTQGR